MKIIGTELRLEGQHNGRGAFRKEIAVVPCSIEIPHEDTRNCCILSIQGTIHTSIGDFNINPIQIPVGILNPIFKTKQVIP